MRENGKVVHLLVDLGKGTTLQLTFLQYVVCKFFQLSPARSKDGADHVADRCGVEMDTSSIETFLGRLESRGLLEPDRHTKLSLGARVRISTALEEVLRAQIAKLPPRTSAPAVRDLVSDLLGRVRKGDIWGVLELVRKPQACAQAAEICLVAKTWIEERLSERSEVLGDAKELGTVEPLVHINPERAVPIMRSAARWMFSPIGLLGIGGLLGYACVLRVSMPAGAMYDMQGFLVYGLVHPILFQFLAFFCDALHECGHAVVCSHFGGRVRRMGVALVFGIVPGYFADVTDSYFMPRRQRVLIMLGGALANALLSAAGIIVFAHTTPGSFINTCADFFAIANAAEIFITLVPVVKSDGYFILSDLTGIQNLWGKSAAFAKAKLGLAPMTGGAAQEWPGLPKATLFFLLYLAPRILFLWIVGFFVLNLTTDARSYRLLGLLGVFVALSMQLENIKKWVVDLILKIRQTVRNRRSKMAFFPFSRRFLYACLLITGLTFLPFPYTIRVKAVVRSKSETVVRARTEGVLTGIFVRDGDSVSKGERLAELANVREEMRLSRASNRVQALDYEIQARLSGKPVLARKVQDLRLEQNFERLTQFQRDRDRLLLAHQGGAVSEDEVRRSHSGLLTEQRRTAWARATREQELAPAPGIDHKIGDRELGAERAALTSARTAAEDLLLMAGMDGVVVAPDLKESLGKFVKSGAPILTLVGRDSYLEMLAPGSIAGEIKKGLLFRFAWIGGGPLRKGRVVSIQEIAAPQLELVSTSVFPKGAVYKIVGDFEGKHPPEFRVGAQGFARVVIGYRPLAYALLKNWLNTLRVAFWKMT